MSQPARIIIVSLICLLLGKAAHSQQGYIYLHVNAQDDATSPDFHFSISNGTTQILNDAPSTIGNITDIGAGDKGELWACLQSNADIYHRSPNSSQWTNTGLTAISIDGAGPGQFVSVDATGIAYFYDGRKQNIIFNPSAHAGMQATDISYGNGRIAITLGNGSILTNTRTTAPYADSWAQLLGASAGATRLDIQPSTGNVVFLSTAVYTIPFTGGTATNIGAPVTTDIAIDNNGAVYANGYYYNGTSWTFDASAYPDLTRTTAIDGEAWSSNANAIFSRTTSNATWMDGERIRTTLKDNAVIIPVAGGIYNMTASAACGWKLSSFSLYDPDGNSVADVATRSAAINVAAGEVVHIVANEIRGTSLPAITGDTVVCAGSRISLSNATAGGVWSSTNTGIATISNTGLVNGIAAGKTTIYYIVSSAGCTDTARMLLTVNAAPVFTLTPTNVTCNGQNNGSIKVIHNGTGALFAINGGTWQTDSLFKGLAPGTYTITVMNNKGCTSLQSATITEPEVIGITVTTISVGCPGDANGSLTAVPIGGVAPYALTWSTGATTNTISRLPVGSYTIVVKDANACTASLRVKVDAVINNFTINTPVKQVGGQVVVTGSAMPNAAIVVAFPDGIIVNTHTDANGNFSSISPGTQPTGTVFVRVTDPSTKAICTRSVVYSNFASADVGITKKLLTTTDVAIGDEVSFEITVNNKGIDHASQLIITDDFPSNLKGAENIAPSKGIANYNAATNALVWNIDTLYVNTTATLTFTARVVAAGVLQNTAMISAREEDADNSNNSATTTSMPISTNFFIPNIITANGDGKNDRFVIKGIDLYPGSTLEIFNRWGNQVYRSNNYNNTWGGEGLSAGIYYYVLKINMTGVTPVYKGYIELITK